MCLLLAVLGVAWSYRQRQFLGIKRGNMFKTTLQVIFAAALIMQVSGCFFVDSDHRDRDHHSEHHDRDPGIDVRIH